MCRKPCKECPYVVENEHNKKFKENVKMLSEKGILEDETHSCHMIETGWDKPTEKNVCIGSLKNKK